MKAVLIVSSKVVFAALMLCLLAVSNVAVGKTLLLECSVDGEVSVIHSGPSSEFDRQSDATRFRRLSYGFKQANNSARGRDGNARNVNAVRTQLGRHEGR